MRKSFDVNGNERAVFIKRRIKQRLRVILSHVKIEQSII